MKFYRQVFIVSYLLNKRKNNKEGSRYQLWNRLYLFYRKLLQVKKTYEIFCFCRQMINTKLLKGNRLLDITPGEVARRGYVKKVFLEIL